MTLISLVFVLLLEHHIKLSQILNDRFSASQWLPAWVAIVESRLDATSAWVKLTIVAVLPSLMMGWITQLDTSLLGALLQLGLIILCLGYAMGPLSQNVHLKAYFDAIRRDDLEAAYLVVQQNLNQQHCLEEPEDMESLNRMVTLLILRQCNFRLFGVMFYFVVFGVAGALIYRLVCSYEFMKRGDEQSQEHSVTLIVRQWLDWLPQRLTGLLYSLAGDFNGAMSALAHYIFKGPGQSEGLLEATGLGALGYDSDNRGETALDENEQAMSLVNRSSIVFVLIIAVLSVFGWLS